MTTVPVNLGGALITRLATIVLLLQMTMAHARMPLRATTATAIA